MTCKQLVEFPEQYLAGELAVGVRETLESHLATCADCFFVARQLGRLGLAPVVVDAHEVRLKAHRPDQKSDGREAFELCEGLRRGIYRSIVHVPRSEISRLRDTLSRRRHFVRLQVAQIGAVKALLRAAGLGRLSRSLGSEAGWARVIAAVRQHQELRIYGEQHRALWRCAREQISALDASLARQQKESFAAEVARLQTIPGVGSIVACTAIAVFSNVERFADAKHAPIPLRRPRSGRSGGGRARRFRTGRSLRYASSISRKSGVNFSCSRRNES